MTNQEYQRRIVELTFPAACKADEFLRNNPQLTTPEERAAAWNMAYHTFIDTLAYKAGLRRQSWQVK